MQSLFSLDIAGYNLLGIPWNLMLILIPCIVVYWLDKVINWKKWEKLGRAGQVAFILVFLYWLFFFPNTAYQFVVPRHLVNYCLEFNPNRVCELGAWKIPFFFTYALLGLPAFYYALDRMKGVMGTLFGSKAAMAFPIVLMPLTTIGVMLGLFLRANSWDVLSRPFGLLEALYGYLIQGPTLAFFVLFTLSLYGIYYGTGLFIRKMTPIR